MNTTPNPLIPQGTFLEQRGRSHIRIAVFTILAIHVVLLGSLLLAGCKRTTDQAGTDQTNDIAGSYPPPPVTQLPPPETTSAPPVTAATTGNVAQQFVGATGTPATSATPSSPEVLPGAITEPAPPTPASMQGEHVVLKGESFSTIAKKYGVTVRAISDANPGVDSTRLKVGQKIVIPAKMASVPTTLANGTTVTNGKTYTVKSGDTLNAIAKKFNLTVRELQAANNLTTTQIKVGQRLKIPTKTAVGGSAPAPGTAPLPEAIQ
ncbi:MAG: LysM peptidoglycan-binding domain-containing protein [Verrucomicrobia subdivision 3 bacterium]|nr:LysM peptidoglycan-binding domain-containing protein [Limisphaerales bacterium]